MNTGEPTPSPAPVRGNRPPLDDGSRTPTVAAVPRLLRPTSLVDLLEASVRQFGARELFSEKRGETWTGLSYGEFAVLVDEVRAGLANLGVKRGDRVGVISGNRHEWAVAAYASYGCGAAIVPMYENQRASDWAFIINDAGISVLFVASPDIARALEDHGSSLPSLRHVVLFEGEAAVASPAVGTVPKGIPEVTWPTLRKDGRARPVAALRPAGADQAGFLYTSGTTGEPKGVVLSHDNIVSNVCALRSVLALEAEHKTLSFLPWAHALGHTVELHMLIASGAGAAIAESITKVPANLLETKPTVLVAVPRVFNKIHVGVQGLIAKRSRPIRWLYRRGMELARKKAGGAALGALERRTLAFCERLIFSKIRARFGGRLRFAVCGAAALEREVAAFMEALGIEVYEGYGLTETSPIVSANVPGLQRLGSVGKPLPGIGVDIDKTFTSDGRNGEIVVFGPNVMVGYHNRPEETRAMFSSAGGLRTGDIGHFDEDGFLYITGRLKEIYKLSNGKYVAPAPLEERLKLSPLIANVMICGADRARNVALIVPAASVEGTGADAVAMIRAEIDRLSDRFRSYERIAAFRLIGEDFTIANGLLTPSLKVRRAAVAARHADLIAQLYAEVSETADLAGVPAQ
ncbi:MAG TPA: AMP-binding protein [Polyangia bacterium]